MIRPKRPEVGEASDQSHRKAICLAEIRQSFFNVSDAIGPRSENPNEILKGILSGVSKTNFKKTNIIVKRDKAIEAAHKYSREGDIVLIAGKGHENYQEINGEKIPFDDFKIAKQIFK